MKLTAAVGLLAGLASPVAAQFWGIDRCPEDERMFRSEAVDNLIEEWKPRFKDPYIAKLFENCLPNTLDTTVNITEGRDDTFIITGDINAMWLRDSTNQVMPYVRFAKDDVPLGDMLCGLVRRQARLVLLNPYANAYRSEPGDGTDGHPDDETIPPMTDMIWEMKWELDSLAAVLKLAYAYYDVTSDDECFTGMGEGDESWLSSLELLLDTMIAEQNGIQEEGECPPYSFVRETGVATDTLQIGADGGGRSVPSKRTGMVKCAFRPSDDTTHLPFLVPANAMAIVELRNVASIMGKIFPNNEKSQRLTQKMEALHQEMEAGLRGHAIGNQKDESDIMAFEVDGFGSKYFTDDANIPSLLSLPYLGYMEKDDPLYLRTREFLLSENNPHNYKSTVTGFNGIGGPHVGWGHIWPMAITIQAITSTDDDEIMACLEQLKATDAGTYFMHETFWMDDADRFSRSWFAWANTLFGELIIELAEEKPHLIFKDTDPTLECVPTGLGNEMEEITEAWCQENCFDGDGVLAPACEPNSGFVLCECN